MSPSSSRWQTRAQRVWTAHVAALGRLLLPIVVLALVLACASCTRHKSGPEGTIGTAPPARSVLPVPTQAALATGGAIVSQPAATLAPAAPPTEAMGGPSPIAATAAAIESATAGVTARTPAATASAAQLVIVHTNDNWGEAVPCG